MKQILMEQLGMFYNTTEKGFVCKVDGYLAFSKTGAAIHLRRDHQVYVMREKYRERLQNE